MTTTTTKAMRRTKGSGSIAQRNGKWHVVVDHGRDPETGKRRRRWTGPHKTKKAAEKALRQILSSIDRGTYVEPTKQTFAEYLLSEWLPAVRVSLRASTHASYERNLRLHVVRYSIGATKLSDVSAAQLNRLYAELLEAGRRDTKSGGLSPRSVRYLHTIIHRAMSDAVRWNRLVRNVADAATPPRVRDVREAAPAMRVWTADELEAFFARLAEHDDRYYTPFYVHAMTGARRGEVLGLTWDRVDLDAGLITVDRAWIAVGHEGHWGKTKTGRPRTLELDARTVDVLKAWRARRARERLQHGQGKLKGGDFVFTHRDGTPYHPERFSREFDRRLERYPELPKIRLHDLRHTWATLALRNGVHPKIVSEQLGHSSIAITLDVYSHVIRGLKSDAAQLVSNAVFGPRSRTVRGDR